MSVETKSPPLPNVEGIQEGNDPVPTRKGSFMAWVQTVWGLIIHTLSSLGIVVFAIFYVEHRPFNVEEHHATVQTLEGEFVLPYALTQSDVATILSSMVVLQKWALAAWVAPLCWRAAVFLMERGGLHRQDFKTLVKYKLLTPRTHLKSLATFLIGTLLLACLGSNFSSPLLTGSITWVPMNHPVNGLALDPAQLLDAEASLLPESVQDYRQQPFEASVGFSVGYINTAWGHDIEKGVYKQVSTSVSALAINSTIENVTLPYFEVQSLEWIKNAKEIPNFPASESGLNDTKDVITQPLFDSIPSNVTWLPNGFALLVPNIVTKWSNTAVNSTIVSERRLLVLNCAYDDDSDPSSIFNVTSDLPASAYRLHEDSMYYAFAWVTFSAGVGRCDRCNISSTSTVRNNGPMKLEPHPLTSMALAMAPSVSLSLVAENSAIPDTLKNTSTGDYVESLLVRSYSGAWMHSNNQIARESVNSSYAPSLPVLVAKVDHGRAYGWLSVQLFVSFLGAIFVVLQYFSQYPLIGGTALTPFYLNTMDVPRTDNGDPFKKGTLKIQQDNDRLILV